MTSCKYYDCGYCYAPKDIKSNDVKGACIEPEYCPYLKSQMTEKERIEGEIKILQKKLVLIEELEKTKSPVEEAYKKVFGVYPTNEITYNSMWGVFQKGYYAAKEETAQEPEKSKINDLAEKLLPDDHPYKIADEHGETNPYKQYLNSVEDEKKMEEERIKEQKRQEVLAKLTDEEKSLLGVK